MSSWGRAGDVLWTPHTPTPRIICITTTIGKHTREYQRARNHSERPCAFTNYSPEAFKEQQRRIQKIKLGWEDKYTPSNSSRGQRGADVPPSCSTCGLVLRTHAPGDIGKVECQSCTNARVAAKLEEQAKQLDAHEHRKGNYRAGDYTSSEYRGKHAQPPMALLAPLRERMSCFAVAPAVNLLLMQAIDANTHVHPPPPSPLHA